MRQKRPHHNIPSTNLSTRCIVHLSALGLTLLIGLRQILPGPGSRGKGFDTFCVFGGMETLWPYLTAGTTLKNNRTAELLVPDGDAGDVAALRPFFLRVDLHARDRTGICA